MCHPNIYTTLLFLWCFEIEYNEAPLGLELTMTEETLSVTSLCVCLCVCTCGSQKMMLGVFYHCFPSKFLETEDLGAHGFI